MEDGVKSMSSNKKETDKPLKRLSEFWWDRVILSMITVLLGITATQTIVSLIRSETVKCLIAENDTTSSSIIAYVNNICSEQISYQYQMFVYAEVAVLSGLQVFWSLLHSGRLEDFRMTVNSMVFIRSSTQDQVESSDIQKARALEHRLRCPVLTVTYIFTKLVLQFLMAGAGIVWSVVILINRINILFECSKPIDSQWPLSSSKIDCVYTAVPALQFLLWINLSASIIIVLATVFGIVLVIKCFFENDCRPVALFMLETGLQIQHYRKVHFWKRKQLFKHTRVSLDMALLMKKFYGTNYSKGEALFNVLVYSYLEELTETVSTDLKVEMVRHGKECLAVKIEGQ